MSKLSTVAMLQRMTRYAFPSMAAEALILVEAIRVVPAEVRMVTRVRKRKHANAAEILFFVIKYLAIIAYLLDLLLGVTSVFKTDSACLVASFVSTFGMYAGTSLVAASLAWRCYIIFGRQRRTMYFILAGLMMHTTVALYTWQKALKYNLARHDGYGFVMCDRRVLRHEALHLKPWWALQSVWFLVTNVMFDAAVVGASTRRLLKHARGPTGFAETSKMLFTHGLHYGFAVCVINSSELIVIFQAEEKTPSFITLSIALQIIAGLNLLLSEQDAVHGFKGFMVSDARPSSSFSASGSSFESRPRFVPLRPSISSTQLSSTQLLRKRSESLRSRTLPDRGWIDQTMSDPEEFRSCKVSFSDALEVRALHSHDSVWMHTHSDYPAIAPTPQPPLRSHATGQTMRSSFSIRDVRYRAQDNSAAVKGPALSPGKQDLASSGRARSASATYLPVLQLSPFRSELPDNLARSDSFGQQRLNQASSDTSVAHRAVQGSKIANEIAGASSEDSTSTVPPFPPPANWRRETLVQHEEVVDGAAGSWSGGRVLLQVQTPISFRPFSLDSIGSVYSNATDYLSSETHVRPGSTAGSSQLSPTIQPPHPSAMVDSPTDHWRPSTFGYEGN